MPDGRRIAGVFDTREEAPYFAYYHEPLGKYIAQHGDLAQEARGQTVRELWEGEPEPGVMYNDYDKMVNETVNETGGLRVGFDTKTAHAFIDMGDEPLSQSQIRMIKEWIKEVPDAQIMVTDVNIPKGNIRRFDFGMGQLGEFNRFLHRHSQIVLQKNRALWYASAEDLAADLRAVLQGKGISPRPRPPIPWTRVSVAALAVAVVAAVGWWLVTRDGNGGGGGTTAPCPVIAVLPFEDATDQADGPSKAAMVADLLGRTLGQTKQLRAVDPDRLADVLGGVSGRDGAMERIARHLPVAWIAAGRIYREGENWLAAIDVFRPGTPEPVESVRVEGSTRDRARRLGRVSNLGVALSGRRSIERRSSRGRLGLRERRSGGLIPRRARGAQRTDAGEAPCDDA